MKTRISTLLAVLGLCLGTQASAQGVGPSSFNVSGGLFEPSGAAVTNSSVDFQLEVLDKNELCVLYVEEHQNINLSSSKGRFSLELGRGTNSSNRLSGGGAFTNALFKNSGATGAFAGCAAGVTLNSGDERVVRVSYDLGAGLQAMTPTVPIQSAAYSMVAETLEGKAASEFLQVRDDATYDLNQTNLESIFSAVNFAKLTQILSGNWGNTTLTNVGTPSAGTDATNKNYVDANIGGKIADVTAVGPAAGNGHTLIWDQALNRWVTGTPAATDATKLPLAGGTMTGAIAMGAQNITNIGHMTMAAQRTLNLGTYDNAQEGVLVGTLGVGDKGKIWFNSQANVFKVWDGTAAVSTFGPSGAAGGDLTGTYPNPDIATGVVGSTELTDSGVATIDIANDAISSAKINNTGIAVNRLLITDATTGATVTYKTCALDEGLKWTATGWACSTAAAFIGTTGVTAATYGNATQVGQVQVDAQGRIVTASNVNIAFPVVSVAGKTGAVTLNTADISGLGTAALKAYGTAAGNLVELDAGGKIPASLLPSTSGDIQDVIAGSGLTGGGSSGSVTLAVDTGVTNGKIVAVGASDKLPAIDGSNLTQINAVKLQARDVAAAAPTAAQVLTWNAGSSAWEPQTLPAGNTGDITSVSASTGLTGGSATGDATLAVDVGTVTGKIVQMAASDKLPAVDGSDLTQINAVRLQTRNVAATAPTASQVLRWNAGTSVWEPGTETDAFVGTVTSVVGGSGLLGGNITSTGTLAIDVGVTTGKIIQVAASDKLPVIDGSNLTFINAVQLQTRNVAATAPTSGQYLVWNSASSVWEPQTLPAGNTGDITSVSASTGLTGGSATGDATLAVDVGTVTGKIVQMAASDKLPAVDGSNLTFINAVQLQTRNVASAAPTAAQVLTWNAGSSAWEPQTLPAGNTGDITSVSASTGLTGGSATGDATLAVDVGTVTGKIVQMAASDKLPAVDGSDLTQINAVRLQTRNVAATAPTASQVLRWNAGTSVWEPSTESDAFVGTVTSVVGGSGLLGGNITSTGTLAIDVGVTTGKIIQVAASDKLPVIDGSNLTFINAVQLQTRNVAATAPTAAQVLTWNAGSSAWEPQTLPAGNTGDITSVSASTGLTGGSASGDATLAVDVGTVTGKIVQMAASDKLPAVDGSNLTAINAVQLQTRNVASAAPTAAQVLTWNAGSSAWEPQTLPAGNAGDITSVSASTGLTGGSASGDATLAVDVGTTAGKIVQMAASDKLPAVDGSNLTAINAVQLQTRNVAATAPTSAQVLAWNSGSSNWEPQTVSVSSGGGFVNDGNSFGAAATMGTNDNFALNLEANNSTAMTILPSGSIGIGTTSPNLPAGGTVLHINDPTASEMSVLHFTNAQTGSTATDGAYIGIDATDKLVISQGENSDMLFYTNGTEKMRISGAGNVGIGTTSANQLLTVEGPMSLRAQAAPSLTANYGKVYVDSGDANKLKYMNPAGSIVDLTAGAAAVTSVVSGSGLLGGNITTTGTLAVDVGTTTGKIVQMAASDKLPAVDGSNLTAINAVQLQARNVASTAPTSAQVLSWNAGTSVWEPQTLPAGNVGDITSVSAGTGLTGGSATGDATLAVDVGTVTGKIVQMAASDKLPAVDGSNLTAINAVQLQTRNVSATAPTANQVLAWNAGNTTWEPKDAGGGASTFTNGGNSFGAAATLGTNDNFALNFEANDATAMTILPSGNVGIGFGTPTAALQVGDANGVASPRQIYVAEFDASGAGRPAFVGNWSASGAWGIGQDGMGNGATIRIGSTGVGSDWDATQDISLVVGSKIGIGTSSAPTNTLHARVSDATTNATTNLLRLEHESTGTPAASFGTGILFTGESSTTSNQDMAQISSIWTTATHASRASAITFSTLTGAGALTERVRIDGAGNVGIGAAVPLAKLHAASGNNNGLMMTYDSSGNYRNSIFNDWTAGTASLNYMFLNVSNGTATGQVTAMTLRGDGNVGIGTSTPGSKLEVNGRIVSTLTSDADALSALTVDFSNSNVIDATGASAACGTLNITNTVSGGSFTLTIPNATSTCTTIHWNGAATGVKLPAGYAGGVASSGLVYSFIHSGSTLWVTNVTY